MPDILRAHAIAIALACPCEGDAKAGGYPDADDLDDLRKDSAFKSACGRLPESADDLASQPTMSRWDNAAGSRTLIRLAGAIVQPRRESICHTDFELGT
jgi:hypothetical protein